MEEAAVHAAAVQNRQRSPVRIGQDRLAAKLGNDSLKTLRDFIERLIPRYAFERPRWDCRPRPSSSEAPRLRPGPLRRHSPHGIQHPLR
jgi:hypothetical protein